MKKFKRIAYIILILIVAILSLTIYTNATENNSNSEKEKTFTELKYVETKLIDLLNTMNNIKTKNYDLEVGELSKESTQKATQDSSSGQGSQGGSSGGGQSGSQGGQSSGSSGQSGQTGNTGDEESKKKYDLKLSGVLTNNEEINWDYVKNEVELLYTSIPTITLDMYQLQINKDDILNFNKELDKLAIIVKNENKEQTLAQLTKMYAYLPNFFQNVADENWYKVVTDTKVNIFKGYSKLDGRDWQAISNDIQNAINEYTKLMSDTSIKQEKQYAINKGYIMLNELQNAVNTQDASVFLIKYKNLIEQIDNL